MSYKKCVVSDCRFLKTETLHQIAKKPANRMIWIDHLNLPETVYGRVCSKRFKPYDFDIKGDCHIWLKSNSNPKRVELDGIEAIDCPIDKNRRCTTNVTCVASTFDDESDQIVNDDGTEWKEIVINIDDLSRTGKNDTIADLTMNCSVNAVYHNNIYEKHNYSTFAQMANKGDWLLHCRRELQFNVNSFRILSSSLAGK